ncbi:MAG: RIP metalloprotease RseP [Ignavibacteriales bacterium]|nr:RIP metalloprotease RseP [Ignavibacteriales bacterium]
MGFLTTIFYFLITIGVLVLVHELGHFFAAKFFGMRVDRFSIGFPPRAFGKQIGETDYCVSWIPIGGYVKIAGMVDESLDTDFIAQEPQPWEFRSKPIWQRMIVICAGVIMNILLAIAIFWGIIFYQGKTIRPVTEIGYITAESPAAKAGFRVGDEVISVNGKPAPYWEEIENLIYTEALSNDLAIVIRRNAEQQVIRIPRSATTEILEDRIGMYPKGLVPVISGVEAGKPAEKIGLQPRDVLLSVNDVPVTYHSLPEIIKRYAGTEVLLKWKRGEVQQEARVTPTVEGRIGVALGAMYTGPIQNMRYSIFEAFPQGIRDAWEMSWLNLKSIFQIFTGKVSFSKSVAGPIMIAQMATRSAEVGIVSFLGFMALLSMNLAIINLLPFPALDGGHFVFLLYEAIFRREIPNKVKVALQQVGFVLLLVFMAFVLYNDIIKF